MASEVTLNSQIIQVLCGGTATTAELLSGLMSRVPAFDWTLGRLQPLLVLGVRQGRFLRVTTAPDRYQVRQNMAFVFPSNVVYQNLCGGIMKRYACT